MSVPVISDGIRSGVNWMRLNDKSSASASDRISSVLASPGTPVSNACSPQNNARITSSITASCPTIAFLSSCLSAAVLPASCSANAPSASDDCDMSCEKMRTYFSRFFSVASANFLTWF